MNDVKFRIWLKKAKCYSYDFVIDNNGNVICSKTGNVLTEDDCILEQYTGRQDKNGVKIYKGDVLEVEGYNSREGRWKKKFNVIWDYGFCLERDNVMYAFFGERPNKTKLDKGVVVGNIHENSK